MDMLWLGYDGLNLRFDEIAAVLHYQPALNRRIMRAYGRVPRGVLAVVVTVAGAYLPARYPADRLRQRWAAWSNEGRMKDEG